MRKAGGLGRALILSITCCSVTAASLLASPLNPMCVSLICTKLKLPSSAAASPTGKTRDAKTPPVAVQTTPVPTHAMHSRKPRRFMRSMWSSSARLVDDDGPLHERMQVTGVRIDARRRERVREALREVEPRGPEESLVGRDGMGLLIPIRPPDGCPGGDGEGGRDIGGVLDLHGGGRRGRHLGPDGEEHGDHDEPGGDDATGVVTPRAAHGPQSPGRG